MPIPIPHKKVMEAMSLAFAKADTGIDLKGPFLFAMKSRGLLTAEQYERYANDKLPPIERRGEILFDLERKDEHMLKNLVWCLMETDQTQLANKIMETARKFKIPEDQYKMPGIEDAPSPQTERPTPPDDEADGPSSYIS